MAKKPAAEVKTDEVKTDEVKTDEVKTVTVKVLCNALGEGDDTYLKGESFETTAERASALGDSVQIVS